MTERVNYFNTHITTHITDLYRKPKNIVTDLYHRSKVFIDTPEGTAKIINALWVVSLLKFFYNIDRIQLGQAAIAGLVGYKLLKSKPIIHIKLDENFQKNSEILTILNKQSENTQQKMKKALRDTLSKTKFFTSMDRSIEKFKQTAHKSITEEMLSNLETYIFKATRIYDDLMEELQQCNVPEDISINNPNSPSNPDRSPNSYTSNPRTMEKINKLFFILLGLNVIYNIAERYPIQTIVSGTITGILWKYKPILFSQSIDANIHTNSEILSEITEKIVQLDKITAKSEAYVHLNKVAEQLLLHDEQKTFDKSFDRINHWLKEVSLVQTFFELLNKQINDFDFSNNNSDSLQMIKKIEGQVRQLGSEMRQNEVKKELNNFKKALKSSA